MNYKENWSETKRRLTALWYGERLDRPCVAVRAPQPARNVVSLPQPVDDEAYWLNPECRIALLRRTLEGTWWGGETVPGITFMPNWVLCLGGTPRFDPHTIWFETQTVDFAKPSPFRHDPDSPWTLKYTCLLVALCQEAQNEDVLIGKPGGLPANDLLSMLMGTQEFLIALMDQPEWMAEAILTGARDQSRVRLQLQKLMRDQGCDYWYGQAGWMPFWAPDPYTSTQSDVSCMLSPEMFDRFVLPELEVYAEEHGSLWHHLDGVDAKQHLSRLLSLPFLRVVQYTPTPSEPPNGPAHMEMYRKIQAAGKIVHISLPVQNIEPLVRELDPSLLMLDTDVSSQDTGECLLEQCVQWTKSAEDAG